MLRTCSPKYNWPYLHLQNITAKFGMEDCSSGQLKTSIASRNSFWLHETKTLKNKKAAWPPCMTSWVYNAMSYWHHVISEFLSKLSGIRHVCMTLQNKEFSLKTFYLAASGMPTIFAIIMSEHAKSSRLIYYHLFTILHLPGWISFKIAPANGIFGRLYFLKAFPYYQCIKESISHLSFTRDPSNELRKI